MLHLAYVAAVDLPDAGCIDLGSAVVAGEVSSPHHRRRRRAALGGERRHGRLVRRWDGLGAGQKNGRGGGSTVGGGERRREESNDLGRVRRQDESWAMEASGTGRRATARRGCGARRDWASGRELGGGSERRWEESDGARGRRGEGGGVAAPGGIGHRDGAGRLGVETVVEVVGDVVADRANRMEKTGSGAIGGRDGSGVWAGSGMEFLIPYPE